LQPAAATSWPRAPRTWDHGHPGRQPDEVAPRVGPRSRPAVTVATRGRGRPILLDHSDQRFHRLPTAGAASHAVGSRRAHAGFGLPIATYADRSVAGILDQGTLSRAFARAQGRLCDGVELARAVATEGPQFARWCPRRCPTALPSALAFPPGPLCRSALSMEGAFADAAHAHRFAVSVRRAGRRRRLVDDQGLLDHWRSASRCVVAGTQQDREDGDGAPRSKHPATVRAPRHRGRMKPIFCEPRYRSANSEWTVNSGSEPVDKSPRSPPGRGAP